MYPNDLHDRGPFYAQIRSVFYENLGQSIANPKIKDLYHRILSFQKQIAALITVKEKERPEVLNLGRKVEQWGAPSIFFVGSLFASFCVKYRKKAAIIIAAGVVALAFKRLMYNFNTSLQYMDKLDKANHSAKWTMKKLYQFDETPELREVIIRELKKDWEGCDCNEMGVVIEDIFNVLHTLLPESDVISTSIKAIPGADSVKKMEKWGVIEKEMKTQLYWIEIDGCYYGRPGSIISIYKSNGHYLSFSPGITFITG